MLIGGAAAAGGGGTWSNKCLILGILILIAMVVKEETSCFGVEAATPKAYVRREAGHLQWHHGALQDVKDSVRCGIVQMLHSGAGVYCFCSMFISVFFSAWKCLLLIRQ